VAYLLWMVLWSSLHVIVKFNSIMDFNKRPSLALVFHLWSSLKMWQSFIHAFLFFLFLLFSFVVISFFVWRIKHNIRGDQRKLWAFIYLLTNIELKRLGGGFLEQILGWRVTYWKGILIYFGYWFFVHSFKDIDK